MLCCINNNTINNFLYPLMIEIISLLLIYFIIEPLKGLIKKT